MNIDKDIAELGAMALEAFPDAGTIQVTVSVSEEFPSELPSTRKSYGLTVFAPCGYCSSHASTKDACIRMAKQDRAKREAELAKEQAAIRKQLDAKRCNHA